MPPDLIHEVPIENTGGRSGARVTGKKALKNEKVGLLSFYWR